MSEVMFLVALRFSFHKFVDGIIIPVGSTSVVLTCVSSRGKEAKGIHNTTFQFARSLQQHGSLGGQHCVCSTLSIVCHNMLHYLCSMMLSWIMQQTSSYHGTFSHSHGLRSDMMRFLTGTWLRSDDVLPWKKRWLVHGEE